MRRQHSIAALVYQALYPNPGPTDPPDFSQHLIRFLITEVRIETQRFFGGLDTIEAKYPGLNYSSAPHRKRLSQFPYHAQLFKIFDQLGLTAYEIGELCKWEGTLWARQRYERDEGIKVLDTTGNDVRSWVRRQTTSRKKICRSSIRVNTHIAVKYSSKCASPNLTSIPMPSHPSESNNHPFNPFLSTYYDPLLEHEINISPYRHQLTPLDSKEPPLVCSTDSEDTESSSGSSSSRAPSFPQLQQPSDSLDTSQDVIMKEDVETVSTTLHSPTMVYSFVYSGSR